MRLPNEKWNLLNTSLTNFLQAKKVSLRELQSFIGLLNFAYKVVAHGHDFCRRLINSTIGITKLYHRIKVTKHIKADLRIWQEFLKSYNGISVFFFKPWVHKNTNQLFTDSEGGQIGVFGISFRRKWAHGSLPIPWAEEGIIKDMTFLEPFPVVVALILRQSQFANSKLLFHIDNM